jgi:nicotinamide-nucleotide amidase
MHASIIIIGDELLNGRASDANGPYLAKTLFNMGIDLKSITIVHDQDDQLCQAIKDAWEDSDLVITTGGLGPTEDDKTKGILCQLWNGELLESIEATTLVTKHYQRLGKSWDSSTNSYHMIPKGFFPLFNPKGLAPGLGIMKDSKLLLSFPGVPREAQAMMNEVAPALIQKQLNPENVSLQQITIKTVGVSEEKIYGELDPLLWRKLEESGKVASYPNSMGVDIVVIFPGDLNKKEKILNEIKSYVLSTPLASHVWQWGELTVAEYLINKARLVGKTIGFAESCTGGLSASKITDIAGCSDIFKGSIVSYSNEVKTNVLGVSETNLQKFGAVSIETAQAMALGALNILNCDYAVSYTGIAGPSGGTVKKPVGTVAIAVAHKGEVTSKLYQFSGGRQRLKERFSEQGLFDLLSLITDI